MIDIREIRIDLPGFTLGPVSLHVAKGGFFALMGPTGSGKTLLLETTAGLLHPDAGSIHIAGREATKAPPEQRNVGLVYQDHALFPHMSVLQNIVYGQKYGGMDVREGENYARGLMQVLGLEHLESRRPENLSGGEKQRTALARALACRPDVVLLDEPLSSLDPQFKEGLRKSLKELHRTTGATFFMVTHDFVDALSMADSAAVINQGRIEQSGTVMDIFRRPATRFIADFVGMKNIFAAEYRDGCCRFAGFEVSAPAAVVNRGIGFAALRPEDVHVAKESTFPPDWITLPGKMQSITREGFAWSAMVVCNETAFTVRLEHRMVPDVVPDNEVSLFLGFDPCRVHHIPNTPERRT